MLSLPYFGLFCGSYSRIEQVALKMVKLKKPQNYSKIPNFSEKKG
jgi:hypothetical protein